MVQLKLQLAPDDSNHRLFQFHDGTIKTVFSICLEIHFIYFNSMMVQLKLTLWISDIEYNWDFNSMMVQLKHGADYDTGVSDQFQFHDGTIKTHRHL